MFEKVNPSHPDKVADRIAGAMVDLAYEKERFPKIAVEVLIGHGNAFVIAETSVMLDKKAVSDIVLRIANIHNTTFIQVPQNSCLAANQAEKIKCGDNGIFKGCPVTYEQFMLKRIADDIYKVFPFDGKFILHDTELTICQSEVKYNDILENIAKREGISDIKINPIGPWTGGPDVDCGATNRKLGSDMGNAVTGGGLHGKDLSKADVTLNIYCHIKAQQLHKEYSLCCAIGDEVVDDMPYSELVEIAREYIKRQYGSFEKFAEWGLI